MSEEEERKVAKERKYKLLFLEIIAGASPAETFNFLPATALLLYPEPALFRGGGVDDK